MKNPEEEKFSSLSFNLNSNIDIKPTTEENKKLLMIIEYPPLQEFSFDENFLLRKFRYHLTKNKKGKQKNKTSINIIIKNHRLDIGERSQRCNNTNRKMDKNRC
jgi:hypothetical protein